MSKKILLSTITLFISICGFSQINPNTKLPDIMPSNPGQYQFLKYGEVPVGKYTGVPSTQVPIYTINAKGLDIPISLLYHSNGFRVNEEAGWTGLGWTLNAGGSINQVVCGTDDFGYYRHRFLPDFQAIDPNIPESAQGTCSPFYLYGFQSQSAICSTTEIYEPLDLRFAQGPWDSEPDIFKFNMLDYSGSFLLDWKNNKFVCLNNKDYKIECTAYNENAPITFYITVTDGHKFKFELKEQGEYIVHSSFSEEFGGSSSGIDLRMFGERSFRTFQLTEITTSQGDIITYNYTLTDDIIGYPSISKMLTFYDPDYGSNNFTGIQGFRQYDINCNVLVTKQKNSYLSSITFNGGSINFSTSSRIDINGAKKLDQILVSSLNPTSIVKTLNFEYSYFDGTTDGTNLNEYFSYYPAGTPAKTTNELTKRLKLVKVTELGQPPYIFEYNESISLPQKTSLATDYWGYYNGYHSNFSMFANLYSFNQERNNERLHNFENNYKNSSLEHTKAAVLNKITYPTKGITEFTYELNTFNNYKVPDANQGTPSTVSISTKPGFNSHKAVIISGGNTIFRGSAFLSTTGCGNSESYSNCFFKIQHFKKELLTYITNNSTLNSHYNNYGLIYVLGADLDFLDGSPSNLQLYNQYISQPVNYVYKQSTGPQDENLNNLLYNLPEGIAVFTVNGGCGVYGSGASSTSSGNISQSTLNLTYRDYHPLLPGTYPGAGLRISSLTSSTSAAIPAIRKKFTYENGILMTPIVYSYRSGFHQAQQIPVGSIGSCIVINFTGKKMLFSTNSFATISTSANGNYVGYSKVTEEAIDKDYISGVIPTNGKTITYYTNNQDQTNILPGVEAHAVILPPSLNSLDNGLTLKEEYYNSGSKIKEIINSYLGDNSSQCFYGAKYAFVNQNADDSQCSYLTCSMYEIGAYPIKTRRNSLLVNTVENNFYGSQTLSNTKSFTYDTHGQLTYAQETNSSGDNIEYFNSYPYDYPNDVVYNGMTVKNQITPMVKSLKKINGMPISLAKQVYKTFAPQKFVLHKTQLTKTGVDTDLEDKVIYNFHDAYGNPVDISLNNAMHVCYIWGYNGRYPIAKIENAEYSDVSNYSNALITASNSGSLTQSSFTNLRNSLPNAMITTFTYKPLVGITSVADQKGDIAFYEYDSFGRLKSVKDKVGNLLTENFYNYKP